MDLRARVEGIERGRWWGQAGIVDAPPERRFHLIGVGLAKTGTTSFSSLFQNYRWGYEFLFAESIDRIAGWRAGTVPRASMSDWLRRRADAGALEADAASFNHQVVELLIELHPEARFLYTPRAPVEWADAFLNMMRRNGARLRGHAWPEWQIRLGTLMAPSFGPAAFDSDAALQGALPQLADELLAFHAVESRKLTQLLPPGRTLVVPTVALSARVDEIADWLGIASGTLNREGVHENQGEGKIPLIQALPDIRARLDRAAL